MRKGFTLIELLAVIVILAIIALIATPLIMNVIDESKKGAFKNTAYGIIKSGELSYTKDVLNGTESEVTFTYVNGVETSEPEGKELAYKGEKPKFGTIKVNSEGKVAIAIYNGNYCAEKNFDQTEVILSDKTQEECTITTELTSTAEEYFIFDSANGSITGYSDEGPKDVVIPAQIGGIQVTKIGMSSFSLKELTSVVIPEGVTKIEWGAFTNNNITSVSLPSTLTSLSDYAFRDNQLTSIVIPNEVTYIGGGAFGGSTITSITIPTNVNVEVTYMAGSPIYVMGIYGDSFRNLYVSNGKLAGTYVYNGSSWVLSN